MYVFVTILIKIVSCFSQFYIFPLMLPNECRASLLNEHNKQKQLTQSCWNKCVEMFQRLSFKKMKNSLGLVHYCIS